ncbi:MAG: YycH family regulatory protein [Enterococcus sp.]
MKIAEKLIRVGLIVMIALSCYLTYVIWLGPGDQVMVTDDQNSRLVNSEQNIRTADEIFLPINLVWLNDEKTQQAAGEEVITDVQNLVSKGSYGTLSLQTYDNQKEFLADADITKGVELSYAAPFLLSEYERVFDLGLDLSELADSQTLYFTKIQLDTAQNKIRFVNPRRNQIAETQMNISEAKLNKLLEDSSASWQLVNNQERLDGLQYNTQEPIKLKMYSYISSVQNYTVFRDAFFETPEDVKLTDDSEELVLYDGSSNLTISDDDEMATFRGDVALTDESNVYAQSYPFISRLGTNAGNFRYFDRTKDEINYRVFVEGFPVFGEDNKGKVSINFAEGDTDSVTVNVATSIVTVQVPIPSEEEVELPASDTVLANILAAGADEELLSSAMIGYQWQDVTNGVVDLVPTWYLNYDETWYSYEELLALVSSKEAN